MAILRTTQPPDGPTVLTAASLSQMHGVHTVSEDRSTGELQVVYDRSALSIADIVRSVEDRGVRVLAVSQTMLAAALARRVASASA